MNKTLSELIAKSKETLARMTTAKRDAMREAQRKSWVRGEMGMGSDKDEAEYDKALRTGDHETLKRLDAESEARMKLVR